MSLLKKIGVPCCVFAAMACGCNPVSSAVKIGVHVVGKVVDDVEVDKIGDKLLGKSAAKADEVLGQPVDVFTVVNSSRQWRAYPVPLDVLNNQRYVVEVADNRIVLVQKVRMDSGKVDIPLALFYNGKLKGKSPPQCEADLKMGALIMALRSQSTGQLCQFYDARLIKELPTPHYCIVRYDTAGCFDKVSFAEVAAKATQ